MSNIKDLSGKIANLSTRMNRSNDIAKVIADNLKDELLENLPNLGSDYAKGAGNDTGYVSARASKQTATISWTGNDIWYLEFGTGSPAVGKYQDGVQMSDAGGYTPRPDGHSLGVYWALPEEFGTAEGKMIVTKGWAPYAPFFNMQSAYQGGKFDVKIGDEVRRKVDSLL